MVGLVLVSHGELAVGLVDAIRMIGGKQDQLEVVTLQEGQALEEHENDIKAAVEVVDVGDGVLIMVDLFGASPFNMSGKLALSQSHIEVISGFNLPMAVEVCLRRGNMDLDELVQLAKESGKNGVKVLSESMEN